MDIKQFWMSAKMGWLRKLLKKEYNEIKKTNNIQNQLIYNNITINKGTEDWLKMLMNEVIKVSGDISLTPTKIITSWGTEKMRTLGRQSSQEWKI